MKIHVWIKKCLSVSICKLTECSNWRFEFSDLFFPDKPFDRTSVHKLILSNTEKRSTRILRISKSRLVPFINSFCTVRREMGWNQSIFKLMICFNYKFCQFCLWKYSFTWKRFKLLVITRAFIEIWGFNLFFWRFSKFKQLQINFFGEFHFIFVHNLFVFTKAAARLGEADVVKWGNFHCSARCFS